MDIHKNITHALFGSLARRKKLLVTKKNTKILYYDVKLMSKDTNDRYRHVTEHWSI